jgi:hypothetical protein
LDVLFVVVSAGLIFALEEIVTVVRRVNVAAAVVCRRAM